MKRVAILTVVAALALVLVMSTSAMADLPRPVIEVNGSGTVPLALGGTTARVTVHARSVGNYVNPTPWPHWDGGKAKGTVKIWVDGRGLAVNGRVTKISTGWEIARGVFIDFKFRGVTYSMYILEDYDLSGDGVWFDLLGIRTDGAPADLLDGGFDLHYPEPH